MVTAATPLDPNTARLLAAGTASRAGRFFVPLPVLAHQLPIAPSSCFVVHVAVTAAGLRICDRPASAGTLSKVIQACPEWRGRPVVIVTVGDRRCRRLALSLFPALAAALRVPVTGSDSDIHLAPGVLITQGTFQCWNPPPGGQPGRDEVPAAAPPERIGRLLPRISPVLPAHCRQPAPSPAAPPVAPALVPAAGPQPAVQFTAVDGALALPEAQATSGATSRPIQAAQPIAVAGPTMSTVALELERPAPIRMPSVSRARPLPVTLPDLLPAAGQAPGALPSDALPSGLPLSGDIAVTASTASAPATTHPAAAGRQEPISVPWVALTPSASHQDRDALKSVLGWRYEAHARAVTGMLALQPGLRLGAQNHDLLAGLVAVRAHLSKVGAQVDVALRSAPVPASDETFPPPLDLGCEQEGDELTPQDAWLLARCTLSGLSRLPAVVGPVFRPGSASAAVLERYLPGTVLAEPAFIEARLQPQALPDSTVEYAIWSSSARRTDPFRAAGDPAGQQSLRVIFGAGAHFVVLGMDDPVAEGGPIRVLLREVSPSAVADSGADEKARQRLRLTDRAARPPGQDALVVGVPAQWQLPVGVREDGSPFLIEVHRKTLENVRVRA